LKIKGLYFTRITKNRQKVKLQNGEKENIWRRSTTVSQQKKGLEVLREKKNAIEKKMDKNKNVLDFVKKWTVGRQMKGGKEEMMRSVGNRQLESAGRSHRDELHCRTERYE
jgi:predicted DNA-binding antitoxin AbrB/MazE fold protein